MACSQKEKYEYNTNRHVGIDTVANGTGMVWKVFFIYIGKSEWDPESEKYLPVQFHMNYTLSNQWLQLKKESYDGGSYEVTDTVAQVLNIPRNGSFSVATSMDPTVLPIDFDGNSQKIGILIRKGWTVSYSDDRMICYHYYGYVVGNTKYNVEVHMKPYRSH